MTSSEVVTARDLPPRDEAELRRWIDRERWKFGDQDWFADAESAIKGGDVLNAHRIAFEGVTAAIETSPRPPREVLVSTLVRDFETTLAHAQRMAEAVVPT